MGLINPGGSPSNTFSSGVYTDNVYERTVDHGVIVDGMLVKNGIPNLNPADPTLINDGDMAYDATIRHLKVRINGSTKNVAVNTTPGVKGAFGGPPPVYNDSNSIILKAGTRAQDSTSSVGIELTSNLTVSLGINGAGGLDTGTEATSTWYYLYLIRKSSDGTCSAVFSTVNESVTGAITYPSGYDQKRQLPFAVRNDGSSNIIPFRVVAFMSRWFIQYEEDYSVLSSGTATTAFTNPGGGTSFSCSNYIPPISQLGYFTPYVENNSTAGFFRAYVKHPSSPSTVGNIVGSSSAASPSSIYHTGAFFGLNTSGNMSYKVDSGGRLSMTVQGYIVTEVN